MRLLLLATATLLICHATHAAQANPQPPNILLIFADDLGYGDLSCHAGKDVRTPHIDSIAAGGMSWARFYANSSVCSPTRAALLTGRYPDRVGVPGVIRTQRDNNFGRLAPDAVLLPALLRTGGYHTALVGKWHLGLDAASSPTARGFEHFHGFLGDMMDDYLTHRRHGNNYMRLGDREIAPQGHATDLFTQWAVDYLRDRGRQKDRPFFLYLAYNAPHSPVQPPNQWLDKVKARERGITDKRAKLVALIEHMDDGVGKVLQALKDAGLSDNTLVLFLSDNGGDLGQGATSAGLRAGKGTMYEGGIRVPMLAAWPGKIAPGSKSDQLALTMDLFPTLCDAAGTKPTHPIDGVSLLGLLRGDEPPKDLPARDLYWVRREGGRQYMGLTSQAVRRGDWKLVQNTPGSAFELYNLNDDPQEKNDLAKQALFRFNVMSGLMREFVTESGRVAWQREPDK
jgi:arylsulfatase A-like enzyme